MHNRRQRRVDRADPPRAQRTPHTQARDPPAGVTVTDVMRRPIFAHMSTLPFSAMLGQSPRPWPPQPCQWLSAHRAPVVSSLPSCPLSFAIDKSAAYRRAALIKLLDQLKRATSPTMADGTQR
jgi:hypothetical protein